MLAFYVLPSLLVWTVYVGRRRRTVLITAVLLATAVADLGALAQDRGGSAIDSAIATALRTGDFRQMAVILERMAKAGDADAQYQLGSLYRSGRGVPQDDALAFEWMKAAAEQGHVRAQFNLGSMYLTGRGVARDLFRLRASTAAGRRCFAH